MSGAETTPTNQSTSLGYMRRSPAGIFLTVLTLIAAFLWFFPIYWAVITSLRADQDTIEDFGLLPAEPTLYNYVFAIINSDLPIW